MARVQHGEYPVAVGSSEYYDLAQLRQMVDGQHKLLITSSLNIPINFPGGLGEG